MNTENIYDAVSGVDQQFVSAADDTDAIRLSFKKNRARKTKIIGSVVCCAVLVLAAGWASFQNRFGKTPSVFLNDPTTADHLPTEPNETQSALTQPGVIPQATERLPSEKPQSPEPSSVTSPVVEATTEAPEGAFEKTYYYSLYNSEYSDYISGKVITPDKVGEKIGDATVTAGWKYADGSVPVTEQLRCEIYRITEIDPATAICIKFLDKGEALTTDHYYVQINASADLSAVSDYIIPVQESNGAE